MSAAPSAAFWTLARVAKALGTGFADDRPVRAVCTDTRAVAPADLFVEIGRAHV